MSFSFIHLAMTPLLFIAAARLSTAQSPDAVFPGAGGVFGEFSLENFPISPDAFHQRPNVAFNGKHFLVAWTVSTHYSQIPKPGDLAGTYVARISTNGVLIDPAGIRISESQFEGLTSNQDTFLIYGWKEPRPLAEAILLSSTESLKIEKTIPLPFPPGTRDFHISGQGDDYLVVGQSYSDGFLSLFHSGTIHADGSASSGTGNIDIPAVQHSEFRMASTERDSLLVWTESTGSPEFGHNLSGVRIDKHGRRLDAEVLRICHATASQYIFSLATGGNDYYVAWIDSRPIAGNVTGRIYGTQVREGTVADTEGRLIGPFSARGLPLITASLSGVWIRQFDSEGRVFKISWDGTESIQLLSEPSWVENLTSAGTVHGDLLIWKDHRHRFPFASALYGAFVAPGAALPTTNEFPVSLPQSGWDRSSLATDGTGFLTVWADVRNFATTGTDIYAARISSGGQVLDPDGVPVSQAPGHQRSPVVTFNGSNYVVAWQDGRNLGLTGSDIYAARISANGINLDPEGVAVSVEEGDQGGVAAATEGGQTILIWHDGRNQTLTGLDIYAAFLNSGDLETRTEFLVNDAPGDQYYPAAAKGQDSWLTVWQDGRKQNGSFVTYASRVEGGGRVLDKSGFPVCTASDIQALPAVASNGRNWLVTWQDARNIHTTTTDIFSARVNFEGISLDPAGIPTDLTLGVQSMATVAAFGDDYLVLWQGPSAPAASEPDLYGRFLSGHGMPLDPTPFHVQSEPRYRSVPAVAPAGSARFLVMAQGPRANRAVTLGTFFTPPAQSALKLAAAGSQDNNVILTFLAPPGTRYTVQWASSLPSSNWFDLREVSVETGFSFTIVEPLLPGGSQRFFRITEAR